MRQFTLNGTQRNYKAAGKKLLPRDSYLAGCVSTNGYRSGAEAKRAFAAEFNAMGGFEGMRLSRAEKRVVRLKKSMSTRTIKRVQQMQEAMQGAPSRAFKYVFTEKRNMKRLFNALEDVRVESEIKAIDARMLRNAR